MKEMYERNVRKRVGKLATIIYAKINKKRKKLNLLKNYKFATNKCDINLIKWFNKVNRFPFCYCVVLNMLVVWTHGYFFWT